jgi:predicted RNA-binding protein with PIN domain
MSLRYIIDGYNVTNHPLFAKLANKKSKDSKHALLGLINLKKLSGSSKNKVTIVFDGYEDRDIIFRENYPEFEIIFSKNESADERIMKLAEEAANLNTVIVSDDKQIRLFVSPIGCAVLGVEEFIDYRLKEKGNTVPQEPELNYSQKEKINQELRKIWLK